MYWLYGRNIMSIAMHYSCVTSRKPHNNGMDCKWILQGPFVDLEFMDLTIAVKENRITTTLFEKQLNIYLYIPPHSARPPGVINEIIYGQIHCITNLCSEEEDH